MIPIRLPRIINSSKDDRCPINPEQAVEINEALKNINDRLERIEQMMFAARVVFAVLAGIAVAAGWVLEHIEHVRNVAISWLKH